MPRSTPASSSRERILDAALLVMRDRGLANTTTKLIAAQAGLSEAMLYKHFADKQQLFLSVLRERTPRARLEADPRGESLAEGLSALVADLMAFFTRTFPIAASIFGSPALLAEHREGVAAHGGGPATVIDGVRARLVAEQDAGRIRPDADTASTARTLVGAAFHQGFLAAFEGLDAVPDAERIAADIVDVVLPGLVPAGR
ncbi:TetR/AcrR family transcriptional regulator [Microbacterium sp. NPDC089698]|uniref:TetR/AcrR family transcriptional regulator n=1 Tax=Microbacterium sp. NPDC089698 TaxID=3364200 RepID=UPI0037FF7D0D